MRKFWHRWVKRRRETPSRATSIAGALEFCRRVLSRKAVLFLISDFIDDDYLPLLSAANRKNDVVCVVVTDPRERDMPAAGLLRLEDAETGELTVVDTRSGSFRNAIAAESDRRLATLTSGLRGRGIDVIRVDASESVIDPLIAFFSMRRRRQGR